MIEFRLSPANQKQRKLEKRLAALNHSERIELLGSSVAAAWHGKPLRVESWATLPGVTCPAASECRAHVRKNRKTGKRSIVDGPDAEIRCYAASMAAQYVATFELWESNTKAMRACKTAAQFAGLYGLAIDRSNAAIFRAGVAGDIESDDQAKGLMLAAAQFPDRLIYGYTKSLPFFQRNADLKPENLRLTASIGGRFDQVAHENDWRTVSVIGSENQATGPIDVDDLQALRPNFGSAPFGGEHFHLLIHGTQRPGTWGSRSLINLNRGKPGQRALSVLPA